MYQFLGNAVVRFWPYLLAGWLLLLAVVLSFAPPWDDVVEDGEFAFLPPDSPSLRAEELFEKAFPDDLLASSVVIVVSRESHEQGLLPRDKEFIDQALKPRLEAIALEEAARLQLDSREGTNNQPAGEPAENSTGSVNRVRTFSDTAIGRLLDSQDNKASLVIVELTTEFLDARNARLIERIEQLIAPDGELQGQIPPGLALATSGSATVGRDMIEAAAESSSATELWTVLLVVILLIAIYRAPVLALIPLVTVAVSTKISLAILAILAENGIVGLFAGIETYVTVLSYGAGVDYCLFLIARYKEELDDSGDYRDAVRGALQKVGAALTASAGTVMCGIGMMVFAQFGKFRQAGVGITLGLLVVLCAALTFTPALLRLAGRWAFWPRRSITGVARTGGWISATSLMGRFMEQDLFQAGWRKVSEQLLKRPGTIWLTSIGLMLPFAVIGCLFFSYLSYGLLSELPPDKPSVVGAKAVQSHFPAGIAGTATILLKNDNFDFTQNQHIIGNLTTWIQEHRETLRVADVRSVTAPLGTTVDLSSMPLVRQLALRRRTHDYYISNVEGLNSRVTRVDVVFEEDPFSRNSISQLNRLQNSVEAVIMGQSLGISFDGSDDPRVESVRDDSPAAQGGLKPGDVLTRINGVAVATTTDIRTALGTANRSTPITASVTRPTGDDFETIDVTLPSAADAVVLDQTQILAIGPTASIRDLKAVTDSDQWRIDLLVLTGVFLILVVLLRKPFISLYLIVTVFFSYLVTLGVTFAVFWYLDPEGFSGLDWKVPMFLFTILIAVGEDYNIFLMTRIQEEQERHGIIPGITVALQKTGSIISSCGIIMAGTFSSLLAGSLLGLHQLGFALAFGVLLDTFVIRPILVPAYLVLLCEGRLGAFGRLFGANEFQHIKPNTDVDAVPAALNSPNSATSGGES